MLSRTFRRKSKKKDLKRKIVGEEIKDIQKKRRFLTATIENFMKDTDKYELDADSLFKAKEDELKKLDKMERRLSFRKENI